MLTTQDNFKNNRANGVVKGAELPSQVAKKLNQQYETDVGVFFAEIAKLPLETLCKILFELPSNIFEETFSRISHKKMATALSYLTSDDLTDFLQRVKQYDQNYAKSTYHLLAPDEQAEVTQLSQFPVGQAGAYMQMEMLSAELTETLVQVKQKVRTFRKEEPDSPIFKLFVVDANKHLVATLHFTDLLLFDDHDTMQVVIEQATIHHHKPLSVHTTTPIEKVIQLFEEYELSVIAVINNEEQLQGRIVFDDIYDLIRMQEQNQALKMAGADKDAEEESLESARKARLHWLFINMVALFFAALIVNLYKDTIEQIVALAVLMPVVAALGGNVGNQAVTVTVRKIALGQIDWQNAFPVIKREVMMSSINGMIMGAVVSVITFIWFHQVLLGLVIAMAIIINLAVAGLMGAMIPLLIKKFGGDPAIASPLLLTTATDAIGFFVFLGLAELILI
ncbi:MAG: magnesium transporter [Gammaproteobacteria bacterium]|nr:MAG: magnesium transporter [Gammaproteobacteria bacterium]